VNIHVISGEIMRGVLRFLACVGLVIFLGTGKARTQEVAEFRHIRDVIYGRKAGLALTMDVMTPRKDANGLGLIFIVSGGWISDPASIHPACYEAFLRRGYTVFTVIHGSQPTFTVPDIVKDVHRAVRFIRYHARDYRVDPDRLGISGASSGGHLSLMQAMAEDRGDPQARDPVDRVSARVHAVVCFFPPTDFLNWGRPNCVLDSHSLKPPFTGAVDFRRYDESTGTFVPVTDVERVRDILRRISPISYVSSDSPPTLLIHGDSDLLVPLQQSEVLVSKLREAGVPVKLIVKKGCGHGWPTLIKDAELVADWFDRYLKEGPRSGR
jgi:acetyl esterase/lipase